MGLHGLPQGEGRQKRLFRILKFLRHCDYILRFERRENCRGRNLLEKAIYIFCKSRPFYYFSAKRDAILRRFSFGESKDIFLVDFFPLPNKERKGQGSRVWSHEDFQSTIDIPFEDTTVPVPVGYESYLKRCYGDYMKFPPVEERESKHSNYLLDLDKPYRDYLKIENGGLSNLEQ